MIETSFASSLFIYFCLEAEYVVDVSLFLCLLNRVDMDHPHLPIYKLKPASSRFVSPKLQNKLYSKISAEEQLLIKIII